MELLKKVLNDYEENLITLEPYDIFVDNIDKVKIISKDKHGIIYECNGHYLQIFQYGNRVDSDEMFMYNGKLCTRNDYFVNLAKDALLNGADFEFTPEINRGLISNYELVDEEYVFTSCISYDEVISIIKLVGDNGIARYFKIEWLRYNDSDDECEYNWSRPVECKKIKKQVTIEEWVEC